MMTQTIDYVSPSGWVAQRYLIKGGQLIMQAIVCRGTIDDCVQAAKEMNELYPKGWICMVNPLLISNS